MLHLLLVFLFQESVSLSGGEVVDFARAQQFMEYYRKRFNFDRPNVVYTPAGASDWKAVMSVGGRKIGLGVGPTRTKAEERCFLDVTQFLESSDPPLWRTFSSLHPSRPVANRSTTGRTQDPSLKLTMSEDLRDEVTVLWRNIRGSQLWSRSRAVGHLNQQRTSTSLGRILHQLPVEGSLGNLVLYGVFYRCLDTTLTLAAVLSDRDPFLAPFGQEEAANDAKDSWSPLGYPSDALAVVLAYNRWYALQQSERDADARTFVDSNFLHEPTLRSYRHFKEQIYVALVDAGVFTVSARRSQFGAARTETLDGMPPSLNSNSDSIPLIAALLATSLTPNFAFRDDESTYTTVDGKVCAWYLLFSTERDDTSRRFCRTSPPLASLCYLSPR